MNSASYKTGFRSDDGAKLALIAGFLLVILYKLYKIYLRSNYESLDLSYYQAQSLYTGFRIVGTVSSGAILVRYLKSWQTIFMSQNRKTALLLAIYPAFYLVGRISLAGLPEFSFSHFGAEIFFNVFTGSFEELVFRGLILIGLLKYCSFSIATLTSSVVFSLWHYDVVSNSFEYINLVLFGLVFSIALLRGGGLILLAAVHFVYDQIHFGFLWQRSDVSMTNLFLIVFNLIYFLILAKRLKESP